MTETAAATPRPDLKILSSRVYRGPNVWHYEPAIQLVVDLGVLEDFPTNLIPGFTEGLLERLPGSAEPHLQPRSARRVRRAAGGGHLAGPRRRARRPAAAAVGRPRHAPGQDPGGEGRPRPYNVIYAYSDESVGLAAGELAVRLVNDLIEHDPEFDFEAELESFIVRGERSAFGPSTQAIVDEAVSRDIPFIRLNTRLAGPARPGRAPEAHPGHHDVQHLLGRRRHRQQQGAHPDAAGLGRTAGAPVRSPCGGPTTRSGWPSRIGYPVVVKPLDGNHGRGVILNLTDDDGVRAGVRDGQGRSRAAAG